MTPSSTRNIAVKTLTRLFAKSIKPKDLLDEMSGQLDERERAFLMELVYGVLRYRDYIDWLLAGFLKKPSSLRPDTVNNLRTAVYQLRYMRVPEWAAVNEAVEIEKNNGGRAAVVNGVLRNYLRVKDEIEAPPQKEPAKYISITTSHPVWMIKRWIARLGKQEALDLALKNNEIPPLVLRIDGDREDALQMLAQSGIEAEPTKYSPAGIMIKGRRRDETSEPDETGHKRIAPQHIPLDPSTYMIQDEAAQLIAYLLDPVPGERILDACAAPGGKTTHIARLMQDRGEVIAIEIDPQRTVRIRDNVARLGLKSVTIINADMTSGIVEGSQGLQGLFDRILVDAPCSSIGVIRRNPDVKYRHELKDLKRFQAAQLDLLTRAAPYLKPGGSMVYSVCSTEPEEGEEVIRYFLQSQPDFSIIEGTFEVLGHFAYYDEKGRLFYRTWPHRDGMDGFFAARFRKMK